MRCAERITDCNCTVAYDARFVLWACRSRTCTYGPSPTRAVRTPAPSRRTVCGTHSCTRLAVTLCVRPLAASTAASATSSTIADVDSASMVSSSPENVVVARSSTTCRLPVDARQSSAAIHACEGIGIPGRSSGGSAMSAVACTRPRHSARGPSNRPGMTGCV